MRENLFQCEGIIYFYCDKIHIKGMILAIFHYMTQWHSISSLCCTTTSTIYFQNVSIIPNGNSVAINQ